MKYFTIKPPEHLASWVRYFWVLEGEASTARPYVHRSMADGCAELIFHYNGIFDEVVKGGVTEKSFSSGLAGPSQYFKSFSIKQNFGMFGVYLYPFAITQLFSMDTTDVTNQMADLKSLLGSEGGELEEKVMLAGNNNTRLRIVSDFLIRKINRAKKARPDISETVRRVIQTNGMTKVDDLASQCYLSTRQFERTFKQFSGFSPKLFSRITRFQTTLLAYNDKHKSLMDIAYKSGYYDQSHFIQEFKEFSGHNPKEYFSGTSGSTVWKD